MASQKPSPIGAKSRSLSVPQDAKSNPSNGLVERVTRIILGKTSSFNRDGFDPLEKWTIYPHVENALSKAREIHALYQQSAVLSSQRGENRSANASLRPGLLGPDTEAVGAGAGQSGEAALSEPLIERLAYEASVWSKDPAHNIGADQPSLVFARRFSFLLQRALRHD